MNSNTPEIIMVGMSRAGTSFMYHNLQKHPDIFVPSRKEVCYFAHNFNKNLKWYQDFFNEKKEKELAIDICGVYFTNNEAIDRIKKYNPDVKIILSVRDPYKWIYSFYEQYSGNFDMPSFSEFVHGCTIKREGEEVDLDFTNQKIMNTIKKYRETFGKNLFIYDFSYFEDNPLEVLQEIEKFIGANNWFNEGNFTNAKINASGRKRSKLFDKLLQVKGFVNIILKIFPRSLVLKLREKWENDSAKNIVKSQVEEKYSKEDQELVKIMFKQDHDYIKKLFEDKRAFIEE